MLVLMGVWWVFRDGGFRETRGRKGLISHLYFYLRSVIGNG